MPLAPLDRLARLLVRHSIDVQPGERVLLFGSPVSRPLLRRLSHAIHARGGEVALFGASLDEEPVPSFPDAHALRSAQGCIFLEPSPAAPLLDHKPGESVLDDSLLRLFLKRISSSNLRWAVTVYPCRQDADRLG